MAVSNNMSAEARAFFDALPEPLVLFGPDRRIRLASRAFCEQFHVEGAEVEGGSLAALPRSVFASPELERGLADVFATRAAMRGIPVRYRTEPAGERDLRIEAYAVPAGGGETGSVILRVRDVTARVHVQAELWRSDERFRLVVDAVDDYAIYMLDPSGHVASWNAGAERIKGYSANEIVGRHFSAFFPADDVAAEKPAHALEVASTEGRYREEGWRVRKDGSRFLAHVVITALRDETGSLRGFVKITRDITEARRMVDDLERSNRELAQFAYIASHDLLEPLRMVRSWVGWLDKRFRLKLDAEEERAFGYVTEGAERMQALVRDLLAYSRIGRQDLAAAPIDSARALASACANLDLVIRETNARIERGDLPVVLADEGQLAQVFQNLLANAIKFRKMGVDPTISITASRRGGHWLFSVRDNGIGVPAADAARIFQIFQRLHTRAEYAGTGIGLAICERIVERHGGRIWVDTDVAEGTAFNFTLPADERTERHGDG